MTAPPSLAEEPEGRTTQKHPVGGWVRTIRRRTLTAAGSEDAGDGRLPRPVTGGRRRREGCAGGTSPLPPAHSGEATSQSLVAASHSIAGIGGGRSAPCRTPPSVKSS